MKKVALIQSPAHLYEVVPIFYKEINRHQYFDKFYLVTDQPKPWGLGDNVEVIQLERDHGRAVNFQKALERMDEDIFVMMCDDHVVKQTAMNLDPYFNIVKQDPTIGRLQLSPPTSNYYRHLKRTTGTFFIPDDSQSWYPYDKQYRWYVNFQPSIWRREFFEFCIAGGENRNKLELRAGDKAREDTKFQSGFIPHYAVRFENFLASCKVHHADPNFDKDKSVAHYREEFAHYAMQHSTKLDPIKRVFVKRRTFASSVPLGFYLKHHKDDAALQSFEVKDHGWKPRLIEFAKRVRSFTER